MNEYHKRIKPDAVAAQGNAPLPFDIHCVDSFEKRRAMNQDGQKDDELQARIKVVGDSESQEPHAHKKPDGVIYVPEYFSANKNFGNHGGVTLRRVGLRLTD